MKKIFVCLIVNIIVCLNTNAQTFDINTLKQTNLNRNKNLDNFMIGASNTVAPVNIATPFATYIVGIATKNKNVQKAGVEMLLSAGINGISTYIMKHSFNRPRPAITYPFLEPLDASLTQYSLPSGHTSASFNTAMSATLVTKKWYVAVPAFAYAGICSYSRMHMGVHYPTDLIGGAITGVASAYISNATTKILQQHSKTKKAFNAIIF